MHHGAPWITAAASVHLVAEGEPTKKAAQAARRTCKLCLTHGAAGRWRRTFGGGGYRPADEGEGEGEGEHVGHRRLRQRATSAAKLGACDQRGCSRLQGHPSMHVSEEDLGLRLAEAGSSAWPVHVVLVQRTASAQAQDDARVRGPACAERA